MSSKSATRRENYNVLESHTHLEWGCSACIFHRPHMKWIKAFCFSSYLPFAFFNLLLLHPLSIFGIHQPNIPCILECDRNFPTDAICEKQEFDIPIRFLRVIKKSEFSAMVKKKSAIDRYFPVVTAMRNQATGKQNIWSTFSVMDRFK